MLVYLGYIELCVLSLKVHDNSLRLLQIHSMVIQSHNTFPGTYT